MGMLEKSRKGMEGLKKEHDEGLIDDKIQQEDPFEEEELSFEERLQRLSKSKEEILREDKERAEKRAREIKEINKIVEDSKEDLQATRNIIYEIFG